MVDTIWITTIPLIALLIVSLGTYWLYKIIRERRSGYPLKDERTIKIQGRASTVAFYLGSWYLILLNFYNMYRIEFQGLTELGSMPVINSAVILMGVTYGASAFYFNRVENN